MSQIPEKVHIPKQTVDIELLNELRDLFARAEDQKERYDFTWNGKAKAYFEAATPSTKTLRPQPEESVDFENSENLFITGDNLEALKLLQESYLGKIDMIYIDPPYNTGKDFVYHDNFKKSIKDADEAEGNVDEEGTRLIKNDKSAGRFHSDWLSMMYPRLKLARNLLSDTGVIFVSIDDNEQANLKLLMDEVFGEDNFVAEISWKRKKERANDAKGVSIQGEYILFYAKSENFDAGRKPLSQEYLEKSYKFEDEKGQWRPVPMTVSAGLTGGGYTYEVITPSGSMITKLWAYPKNTYEKLLSENQIYFGKNGDSIPQRKKYNDKNSGTFYSNVWSDVATNKQGKKQIIEYFDTNVFDTVKPTELIKEIIGMSNFNNGICLDFFAGSSTTADAIMQLNADDKGGRKFILVQLQEQTKVDSVAFNEGYMTIDQISRERIRRAADKLGDTSGFRALKVDSLGIREDIYKTAVETGQGDLLELSNYKKEGRTDYDLLYDVLIDGALEYNRKISNETLESNEIIKYDYFGELSGVICYFGEQLTDELTRSIATLKPLIAVFKESTFNKSSEKVNVLEQFRVISPDTKVKVV